MFYFLQKLPVPPAFSSLKSKIFWSATNFFYENFPPPFQKMGCKCYDIAKPAGFQTNNKSSKYDSMTAEFCKNFYQKTYLKDFQLRVLGNKKVLEKSQIGWRQMLVPSLPGLDKGLKVYRQKTQKLK